MLFMVLQFVIMVVTFLFFVWVLPEAKKDVKKWYKQYYIKPDTDELYNRACKGFQKLYLSMLGSDIADTERQRVIADWKMAQREVEIAENAFQNANIEHLTEAAVLKLAAARENMRFVVKEARREFKV